ncbi:MAG TPA: hypothetical protein VGQ99_02740 [Tepidisphaeraceae bacterium]|jgi:hypothetical protein|nr:hypothetical protein [Tepidisphaeraceae bacterium]
MNSRNKISFPLAAAILFFAISFAPAAPPRQTTISIDGQSFLINNKPTYAGRTYNGMKIEGLLLNARLVQATFDDRNPQTRHLWKYPDGQNFDADRNTAEFLAALPLYRKAGLISFTINLQGGSPQGYSKEQPWHNSALESDGSLRADYLQRLEKILDRADELGMAPILGLFYFGQQYRLPNDEAVQKATDNATDWLLSKGYTNLLIEIANETNHSSYTSPLLKPANAHELIQRVQQRSGRKFLVSTSFTGGQIPSDNVAQHADFLLLHGNGIGDPNRIRKMVDQTRALKSYHNQPILFNEDDHFDFAKPDNNFLAALSKGAGWGYFDFRKEGEPFDEGFQSVPVNWQISSDRKRGFFQLLQQITGGN